MTMKKPCARLWLAAAALALCALCACSAAPAGEPEPTPSPTPMSVEILGTRYGEDTRALTLSADAELENLLETLPQLPALETVTFTGGALEVHTQNALRAALPGVELRCDTELLGTVWPRDTREIRYADRTFTDEEIETLCAARACFPALERLDLTGCGLTDNARRTLAALEGVETVFDIDLYGLTFSSADAEIDLSGIAVSDGGAAAEEALGLFDRLEKVVMCGCGIPDEEMDALNRRHEDVRFVWEVYLAIWSVRTDATNFIVNRTYSRHSLYSGQCEPLRYCTDLIALDLGHRDIVDLSFLYDMPQLQYLILAENGIRDLTPIGSLKELRYLELFLTKAEDLSPLVGCTALQDLNISYIYAKADNAFDALMQMPWLERLWYAGTPLSWAQQQALQENMPDCEMFMEYRGESTGGTWRTHEHYYEMRDVFEMPYMAGGEGGFLPSAGDECEG